MRTALVIIKRPIVVLPPLAKTCTECYDNLNVNWRCLIDAGEHTLHYFNIRSDFLVRRIIDDMIQLSKDLAKMEGKCERVIIVNFGDRCQWDYPEKVITNTVGISHLCDCEGNVLEEKEFAQKKSFICVSTSKYEEIVLDTNLNVFVSNIATEEDLEHYNLDFK